jgi:mannosyltransferase
MDSTHLTQSSVVDARFNRPGVQRRETERLDDHVFWLSTSAIVALAFAVRLITLGSRSLWTDEGYSFWFASQTLHTLWHDVPYYETHPPFYYTLLKGWMVFAGSTEAALRMPSVLASVLTVALLAIGGRMLRAGRIGDQVGLLAAFLLALNKGSIEFAQQARPYALETLAVALMTLLSVRLLMQLGARHVAYDKSPPHFISAAIGLTLSAALTLWLHNTAMFIVFAVWIGLGTTLLVDRERRVQRMLVFLVTGAIAVGMWTPYLPFMIFQSRNVVSNFWILLNWREFPTAWTLATGGKWAFIPMFGFAGFGLYEVWRKWRPAAVHLICILIIPFAMIVLISYLLRPIFMDRLFAWMAPEVVALTALGIVAMPRLVSWQKIGIIALIAILNVGQDIKFYRHPSEDWRTLSGTIASHAKNGDLVIVDPNEAQPPLQFYARNETRFPPLLVVPASFPAPGMARPYRAGNLGVPSPTDDDRPLISAACETHPRVWLVTRGAGTYDPTGIVRGEILSHKKLARAFVESDSYTLELFE